MSRRKGERERKEREGRGVYYDIRASWALQIRGVQLEVVELNMVPARANGSKSVHISLYCQDSNAKRERRGGRNMIGEEEDIGSHQHSR